MSLTTPLTTARAVLENPPAGGWELVAGEVRPLTPAGARHGRIAMRVGRLLDTHVEANNLGAVFAAETGFLLTRDPDTVRAPDVAFVSRERAGAVDPTGFFVGPPDLAVEVISPGDRFSAVAEKARGWLDHGARQVWVIDPETRRALVYGPGRSVLDLAESDVIEGGDLLPGLRLRVADLFPGEPG